MSAWHGGAELGSRFRLYYHFLDFWLRSSVDFDYKFEYGSKS